METNSTLKEAAQRLKAQHPQTHATEAQIIEGMRQDIGPQYLLQAEESLPKLEQAIRTEVRPFLAELATLAAQTKTALPARIQHAQKRRSTARATPAGPCGYPRIQDIAGSAVEGRQIGGSGRTRPIGVSDTPGSEEWGWASRLLHAMQGQVEEYIQKSGWPAAQPGSPTMTTGTLQNG